MAAFVGQEAPFKNGSEQLKVLAGIEVTAKSVERTAEDIGADIAVRQQQEIARAVQLKLPVVLGKKVPVMYIEMDGTGINVVKKETVGRQGKIAGQPSRTREVKVGAIFTQSGWNAEGHAIRDADSTTYVGAIETAEEFGSRLYVEAWNRGSANADKKVVIGDGAVMRFQVLAPMDLESRRPALSRSDADCRSISRPRTSVGVGSQAVPQ